MDNSMVPFFCVPSARVLAKIAASLLHTPVSIDAVIRPAVKSSAEKSPHHANFFRKYVSNYKNSSTSSSTSASTSASSSTSTNSTSTTTTTTTTTSSSTRPAPPPLLLLLLLISIRTTEWDFSAVARKTEFISVKFTESFSGQNRKLTALDVDISAHLSHTLE
ncbi:hypothetical protein PoB_006754700 [Plakobranchus ocellatus]|uniref:Uncharacterized protein n=1 Tax=Plakobranchus ocellatus TaxID=259542 RepID=A0AAV4D9W8_9GAST|nr:hypothetical protein PoB_006754700 [Plakobranchus ocellatus]